MLPRYISMNRSNGSSVPVCRESLWLCCFVFTRAVTFETMGLWDVKDFGVIADKACWSMFAVTTCELVHFRGI